MKTFVFNEKTYTDYKELGIAFCDNYKMALETIQTKEFISFVKSDKRIKKIVFDALYESRSLQSALTVIIYTFTEEKVVIGGKVYTDIDSIINDYDNNPCIRYFFSDKILRKTIIDKVEDEVLKINFKAVEDNADDEFTYTYLKNYKAMDSNVVLDEVNTIFESEDKFKTAYKLFKNHDFLMKLVYKYNLCEVMKIRRAVNPVFDGLMLVRNEDNSKQIEELLINPYYLGIGKTYNKYKYKSIRALDILEDVVRKYKKTKKSRDLMVHKDFYLSYLKFVELCNKKEIIVKKKHKDYAYEIPYCDTYINNIISNKYSITEFNEAKDDVDVPCYNLHKLNRAIKQHKGYIKWNFVFIIVSAIIYAITYFIPYLTPGFNGVFGVFDYVLFASWGIILALTGLIIGKNTKDEKRYNDLCKLNYYRKNYKILNLKQKDDFERIKKLEDKHSIKVDHHYSVIGAFVNAGLAVGASLVVIIVLINAVPLLDEGFISLAEMLRSFYTPTNTFKAVDPYALILPAISSTVPLFIGIVRHKKTALSSVFSVLFGIAVTIILGFIL